MIITESKPDTCYLTKGGYLITLKEIDGCLHAPLELSPGLTSSGHNIYKLRSMQESLEGIGWCWEEDGTMIGLQDEWNEKLQIVKQLNGPIPTLPDGYKWKDRYPRLELPKDGDLIIRGLGQTYNSYLSKLNVENPIKYINSGTSWNNYSDVGYMRLIVEPVDKTEPSIDDEKHEFVEITNSHPDHIPRVKTDWVASATNEKLRLPILCTQTKTIKESGRRFFCLKEDVPPMKNEITVGKSKPDTCYLTAGGYLITLNENRRAPKELSPGTCYGKSINERPQHNGWIWDVDGRIPDLDGDWSEKLRIIKELPFAIPKLPDGYKWAGGYPMLREPTEKDIILSPRSYHGYKDGCVAINGFTPVSVDYIDKCRLIVEKDNAESTIAKSDYVQTAKPVEFKTEVYTTPFDEVLKAKEKEILEKRSEERSQLVDITDTHPNHILRAVIDWVGEINFPSHRIHSSAGMSVKDYNRTTGLRVFCYKENVPPIDDSLYIQNPRFEIMKNQSKFNYFVSEPLSNTYKFIKPSFRYILLYSVIGLIGYGGFHYDKVIDLAKKCLPVVNIEWRNK